MTLLMFDPWYKYRPAWEQDMHKGLDQANYGA
jgi:hypothetical protein